MTRSAQINKPSQARPRRRDRASTRGRRPGAAVVLLAADDGALADRATVCAARLTVALGATLRIVHVVAPAQFRVTRLGPTRIIERRLADPFSSDVLAHARALAWRHGTAATLELVAGDMPRAVIETARRVSADVLVLSAPERRDLLGRSNARRRWIERHAPCQIVTPTPGASAARGEPPQSRKS